MPRLVQALPKYRKHKASGQAIVTLNGVDHYLGPHGTKTSRLQYDRIVAEWLQAGRRSPQPQVDEGVTVVELCAHFLKHAKAYYVKDGCCTGVVPGFKATIKYLRDWYGRDSVDAFGPLALKAVRQRMIDDNLSRRYINDHIARVKRIFKWGAGEQIVSGATYQSLLAVAGLRKGRSAARETPPVLPVDDAAVDATMPHLPPVVADMVCLQRLTGMRPAEVCIIRPCDVDRSGNVWLYYPHRHKTEHRGRERVVFFGPLAQVLLTPHLTCGDQEYCFRPSESEHQRRRVQHERRLTPLNHGNRPGTNRKATPRRQAGILYTTASYRRAITRGCDKAFPHPTLGLLRASCLTPEQRTELVAWQKENRWAPNQLRHAAATRIRARFGLEAAQIALGHSSADVTQIYAERDLARGIDVARSAG